MERNIEVFQGFFSDSPTKVRPYVDAHLCPAIARRQLAAGGATDGILTGTLGTAEVFVEQGFTDVAIAMPVVGSQKINRVCHLARWARITVNVDHAQNVRDLSEAASWCGVTIGILLAVRLNPDRWGVEPGRAALSLAQEVTAAPGLRLEGLSAAGAVPERHEPARASVAPPLQRVLDLRESMEKVGLDVRTVRAGNTASYQTVGSLPGITEVPAGAYVLSDLRHRQLFRPAARVLSTVISRPEPGLALLDLGQKAIGADTGLPATDLPGARISRQSAEHGFLEVNGSSAGLGSKVWAIPHHAGNCVNLYDYINIAAGGRLEVIWPVAARGHYR